MRVVLLADTHGYLDPGVAALVRTCELCIHAGDVGSGEVLAALQPRSGRVVAVRGNNDVPAKWPADELTLLAALPEQAVLELPGGDLVVVHGHRAPQAATRHRWLRQRFPKARAIVYGHSHRLCCDRDALPWVLNPGAAGRSRTFGGPSCLVLEADAERWRLEPRVFSAAPTRARRGAATGGSTAGR